MYLLPPNPGPFGSLAQWLAWRDELLALGASTPGIDVELAVAELAIEDLKVSGSQSQHVTPADGNVFADLGFEPPVAADLLADADARIAQEKNR